MEKQELEIALKSHGEEITKKQADLQKAIEDKLEVKANELKASIDKMECMRAEMQKQLDQLDVDLQKQAKGVKAETKSFAQELKEQLTKEAATLKGMSERKVKELQLEMKSFLESATASITTGSLLPTPQFEAGISKAPDRMPYLLDIINTGVLNSLTVYWVQRKTRTDNSGTVTEGTLTKLAGGSVSQSVLGYETKSASVQDILAFIKVSNNSIDDIEWLLSEIQTELLTLMALKLDGELLSGTIAADGFDGILTGATAFNAGGDTLEVGAKPNRFDALVFALSQVSIEGFNPSHIVLHPADLRNLKLTRDDNGAYMLPPTMATGLNVSVDGVRIISNTGMTKGSYLVGDFSKAKFWLRKGMDLKIHDQNEDDALKQLKTVTLYMRGVLVVKDADKKAFVTDTFADTITEITAV